MFRAILELVITVIVLVLARTILTGLLKAVSHTSASTFQANAATTNNVNDQSGPQMAGELHRDPVCGTFVAESTPFRRQNGRQNFYYCSEACKQKHALRAAG